MAHEQFYLILFAVLYVSTFINAEYIGTPKSTKTLKAFLKHSVELKCVYNNGDGQFLEWYRDDERVSNEKPGHYVVKSSESETKLIIKVFVKNDSWVKKWNVKTGKPGYENPPNCIFGKIPLRSSPQSIDTDRPKEKLDSTLESVRRNEGELIRFKCNVEPKRANITKENTIRWQFSPDNNAYTKNLPDGVLLVKEGEDEISIDRVSKLHRGYYRCSVNNVDFTVLLRVKDRLAALWPFLGIVTIIVVLVIVILIFEKRHKATRKTVTPEDDENNHANDPLVRPTNKLSDNENKKRAIKT